MPRLLLVLSVGGLILAGATPISRAADAAPGAQLSNQEVNASVLPEESAPDLILGEGSDLFAVTREMLEPLPLGVTLGPPLIIPAADFNGDSQTSEYFFSFGSGIYQLTDGCHIAPAYLPNGGGSTTVTVNNFFIFAVDNNAIADITFNLWRKSIGSTTSPQVMATVQTSGESTSVQVLGDTSVVNPVVTSDYAYHITWCYTGTGQGVQGFWIFYTEGGA